MKKSKKTKIQKKYNYDYFIVELKHKITGWQPHGRVYCYEPTATMEADYLKNCGAKARVKQIDITYLIGRSRV